MPDTPCDPANLRVLVVCGTTREGRFRTYVAPWVMDRLGAVDGVDVELLDLREHPLPFFEGPSPARTPREYADERVAAVGTAIDRADAFVVLAAEYNHGYPAVLKNLIDWTFVEWNRKPVSFVGWGNVGGARAIEQLRQVAVELEMAPLRQAVHLLPTTMRAVRMAADAGATDRVAAFADAEPRMDLLVDELTWWAAALREARRSRSRP